MVRVRTATCFIAAGSGRRDVLIATSEGNAARFALAKSSARSRALAATLRIPAVGWDFTGAPYALLPLAGTVASEANSTIRAICIHTANGRA